MMRVIVYSLDDNSIVKVMTLTPRKAHRMMVWMRKHCSGIYWSCWDVELGK